MDLIDFSCKHDVMLEGADGSLLPMDEPFFEPLLVAPGTWRILSAGDYSYLVEGEDEAILIDSGYGCGNIREFCQTLTRRPVRRILNTHHHFDHTANNCYFDCALMSAQTRELATIPFPSFQGIHFPRDYPVEIISEGTVIGLGGRTLETFFLPDHAEGSLLFLDRRERILFCGDEIMRIGLRIKGTVQRRERQFAKLAACRDAFDTLCGGSAVFPADYVDRYLKNLRYILAGHEGAPAAPRPPAVQKWDAQGCVVHDRMKPRFGDTDPDPNRDLAFRRVMEYAGVSVNYDIRRICEEG